MKKKTSLLALFLSCLLVFTALAQPAQTDFEDLAGVIHPKLFETLAELNQALENQLGIRMKVVARDFLGGMNAKAYAAQSLETAADPGAILLLMVIGEEKYELALGSEAKEHIKPEKAESLLTESFREPFLKERAYDKALAAFALKLASSLLPANGLPEPANNQLRAFAGLEALVKPAATQQPSGQDSWLDSIFEDFQRSEQTARQYDEDARYAEEDKGDGLSLFQIALIGFILYKIFGKKRPGKKGCGPLGWIFGTWGLSKFFGWRK